MKVWRDADGVLCRTLTGHAHWINTLALNVDYALRTSCFAAENDCRYPGDAEVTISEGFLLRAVGVQLISRHIKAQNLAKKRYEAALRGGPERLVSGSDDFTLFLWEPSEKKQPVGRMTGHQQLVNQVLIFHEQFFLCIVTLCNNSLFFNLLHF